MILGLSIALLAFAADQISKWRIMELFAQDKPLQISTPYFNLVEAWNTGISFSMLNDGGFWGKVFLIVFALTVIAFLLHWLWHEKNRWIQVALGLIIGGAAGNVADRIRFGAVFDFLDFHYGTWHWPAFNAADSFICAGAVFIIIHAMANYKRHAK